MSQPEAVQSDRRADRAWILSIGTELTLGQTVDTNSAWLARQLAAIGIRCARHMTVADELAPIRDALLEAAGGSQLVLVSGGLGPTADDLTRQALADAAGVALERHEPSVAHLRAFFAARQRPMPEANLVQACAPRGARVLPNACGTAPGLHMKLRGADVYVLPGVPFEMRAMFEQQVLPDLRAAAHGTVVLSNRLNCIGLGESDIGTRIAELMERGRNPEVGTTAELGIIGIRINATAPSGAAAAALLAETEAKLHRRLGHVIFGSGEETLAAVVGRLLVERGATLSTAESCTGGMIGTELTATPGSSRYYLGGVVAYSNAAKAELLDVPQGLIEQHGAVSAPVAEALAAGARRRFASTYALSVTGIAGPDGGTAAKPVGLVYLGIATPDGTRTVEQRFGSDSPRGAIRARAARVALNLLRLELLRVAGGGFPAKPNRQVPGT